MSVLNRLFARALTLDIGEQQITFHGLAEFEFTLAGRTELPAKKLIDLLALSLTELKREAQAIKAVEQRFVEVLTKTMESPQGIGDYLRSVDLLVFSQDHHWREIIRALNAKEAEYDDLRRIALAKYMQYLRARQDVIKQLYNVKKRAQSAVEASFNETQTIETPEAAVPAYLRETLLFDSAPDAPTRNEPEFTRLLKGEATTVALSADKPLILRFSKHPFWLHGGAEVRIAGEHNWSCVLAAGRNLIGRDGICNAIVDNGYRDVSRIHCLIEFSDPGEVRITDLSAHGTYIPTSAL